MYNFSDSGYSVCILNKKLRSKKFFELNLPVLRKKWLKTVVE